MKVTDKRSSVFIDKDQEKRILEGRAENRWRALPRYIKRAYRSKNEQTITKAIQKALDDGWTIEQLKAGVPQEKVNVI